MTDKTKRLALIGLMGVGKTSVAQILARTMGLQYVDMDAEIVKITQMPIPCIFAKYGEGHFRQLEHDFCRQIPYMGDAVISTGGGCIIDGRNRAILNQNTMVIHLKASPDTILRRVESDAARPLLSGGDKLTKIRTLMTERGPLYTQIMDFAIDTDDMDIASCANLILNLVQKLR